MTNKRLWFIIRNIAFVTIAVFVSTYVIYVLLYLLQLKLDTLSDTISLLGGILNLTVVQFLQFVSNAWLSVLLINFLYTQLNVQAETTTKVAFDKETKRNKLVTIGMGLGLFTIFGGYIIFNAVYLTGLLESKPLIISHRGSPIVMAYKILFLLWKEPLNLNQIILKLMFKKPKTINLL